MKSLISIWLVCFSTAAWSQITLIKEDETCLDRNDGKIEVMVEGVSATLMYEWSYNGAPFPGGRRLSGLKPGNYAVTVSTSKGCMGTKAALIHPGGTLTVDLSARLLSVDPTPTPCGVRPNHTYKLYALAHGGTPPYYFSWGESGGTASTIGGGGENEATKIVSGTSINESVTIIDSKKCVDSDGFKETVARRICPKDPNDITGPSGYDSLQWVAVDKIMDYTVRFENDPVFATVPAATVFITVPIDDDIDPFSFRLNTLGFGTEIIPIPDNQSYTQSRLDYADEYGFLLDVTAGLDLQNNRFFWLLETIDPVTGQSPTDPYAGFLPVNDTLTGSGEGFVTFTCKPKPATPTGEVVSHQAAIVFDNNDPLLTNSWSNTIDALPPSTMYTPLPDTLNSNEVSFSWAVSDDPGGCGVQYTRVLSGTNKNILQSNGLFTDTTELVAPLDWGTTYYYKVVSTDFVDNAEINTLDSFYILPQRTIEWITPDRNTYCIADTLSLFAELTTLPNADIYISIDSGYTYTLLASSIANWPYDLVLDSNMLHPYIFVKARNELYGIESVSIPFTVTVLPVVDAGDPIAGCPGDLLYAEATGANEYYWTPDSIMGNPNARYSNIYSTVSQWAVVYGMDGFGCISDDSVYITIHPTTIDSLTHPLCEGDSIFIDGNWITDEGFYAETLINAQGCDSTIITEVYFESPCIWPGGPYVYVHESATGLNNGTSWANAFNELQDAIYVAGRYENVQEIWVAEGTYKPHATRRDTSFVLTDSIRIYGGFLGIESSLEDRTANASLVILSGDVGVADTLSDNSYHVVSLAGTCATCLLDGLTIEDGRADGINNGNDNGAGVYNEGHGTLYNVRFAHHYATGLGGAIYSTGILAELIVENCLFQLNDSSLGQDVVNVNSSILEFRGANSLH